MSYTIPSQASVSRNQGRGRGRGSKITSKICKETSQSQTARSRSEGQGGLDLVVRHQAAGVSHQHQQVRNRRGKSDQAMSIQHVQGNDGERNPTQADGHGSNSLQSRIQRKDAYTVISPNEEKRAHVARVASEEEKKYFEYRESKKLGHVNYVGTVGGGLVKEHETRKKQQMDQRNSNITRRMKSDAYKSEQKRQQNEEYGKKKQEQRKKAIQNEERNLRREEELKEDHKRKNAAFLDRIEKEAKQKSKSKPVANQAPKQHSSYEDLCANDNEDLNDQAAGSSTSNAPNYEEYYDTVHLGEDLQELQLYFPSYDPNYLQGILQSANGDVEFARTLLS